MLPPHLSFPDFCRSCLLVLEETVLTVHLRPDLPDQSQFSNLTTLQLSPEQSFLSPNGPQKQQELTEFSFG